MDRKKGIIIGVAILVVIVGAIVVFAMNKDNKEENTANSNTTNTANNINNETLPQNWTTDKNLIPGLAN